MLRIWTLGFLVFWFIQGLPLQPDEAIDCSSCQAWNGRQQPFRIFGNTYYVGVAGLSAVLVTSDEGLILLDGGLPQSAPLIDESIRSLGFSTEKIRLRPGALARGNAA